MNPKITLPNRSTPTRGHRYEQLKTICTLSQNTKDGHET